MSVSVGEREGAKVNNIKERGRGGRKNNTIIENVFTIRHFLSYGCSVYVLQWTIQNGGSWERG